MIVGCVQVLEYIIIYASEQVLILNQIIIINSPIYVYTMIFRYILSIFIYKYIHDI